MMTAETELPANPVADGTTHPPTTERVEGADGRVPSAEREEIVASALERAASASADGGNAADRGEDGGDDHQETTNEEPQADSSPDESDAGAGVDDSEPAVVIVDDVDEVFDETSTSRSKTDEDEAPEIDATADDREAQVIMASGDASSSTATPAAAAGAEATTDQPGEEDVGDDFMLEANHGALDVDDLGDGDAAMLGEDHDDHMGMEDDGGEETTRGRSPLKRSASSPMLYYPEDDPASRRNAARRELSNRIQSLSRPRDRDAFARTAAEKERLSFERVHDEPPRRPNPTVRPSLLVRVRPTNLEEQEAKFFASGCSIDPIFEYSYPRDQVSKLFEKNSDIDTSLMNEAKRILEKTLARFKDGDEYMAALHGTDHYSAEELREFVLDYLRELKLEDKVSLKIAKAGLAAACCTKNFQDGRNTYEIMLSSGSMSKIMAQGVCDHEIGTHLLRMMNEDLQAWSNLNGVGNRKRFGLHLNPWITEEGFATLNTFFTFKIKLLYPQAMRYYAVCRGTQLGFVALFREMAAYVPDERKRFRLCCRVKRGLHNTGQKGSFYIDQAYFLGAVQILRRLHEIPDLSVLYAGQIALQEIDKVYFLMRRELMKLPHWLRSAKKTKEWFEHCQQLIEENELQHLYEDRAVKEIYLRKSNTNMRPTRQSVPAKTVDLGGAAGSSSGTTAASSSTAAVNRRPRAASMDTTTSFRDTNLGSTIGGGARARASAGAADGNGESSSSSKPAARPPPRTEAEQHDAMNRLTEGRGARTRSSTLEDDALADATSKSAPARTVDFGRISTLAQPRPSKDGAAAGDDALSGSATTPNVGTVDAARLRELAKPKSVAAAAAAANYLLEQSGKQQLQKGGSSSSSSKGGTKRKKSSKRKEGGGGGTDSDPPSSSSSAVEGGGFRATAPSTSSRMVSGFGGGGAAGSGSASVTASGVQSPSARMPALGGGGGARSPTLSNRGSPTGRRVLAPSAFSPTGVRRSPTSLQQQHFEYDQGLLSSSSSSGEEVDEQEPGGNKEKDHVHAVAVECGAMTKKLSQSASAGQLGNRSRKDTTLTDLTLGEDFMLEDDPLFQTTRKKAKCEQPEPDQEATPADEEGEERAEQERQEGVGDRGGHNTKGHKKNSAHKKGDSERGPVGEKSDAGATTTAKAKNAVERRVIERAGGIDCADAEMKGLAEVPAKSSPAKPRAPRRRSVEVVAPSGAQEDVVDETFPPRTESVIFDEMAKSSPSKATKALASRFLNELPLGASSSSVATAADPDEENSCSTTYSSASSAAGDLSSSAATPGGGGSTTTSSSSEQYLLSLAEKLGQGRAPLPRREGWAPVPIVSQEVFPTVEKKQTVVGEMLATAAAGAWDGAAGAGMFPASSKRSGNPAATFTSTSVSLPLSKVVKQGFREDVPSLQAIVADRNSASAMLHHEERPTSSPSTRSRLSSYLAGGGATQTVGVTEDAAENSAAATDMDSASRPISANLAAVRRKAVPTGTATSHLARTAGNGDTTTTAVAQILRRSLARPNAVPNVATRGSDNVVYGHTVETSPAKKKSAGGRANAGGPPDMAGLIGISAAPRVKAPLKVKTLELEL